MKTKEILKKQHTMLYTVSGFTNGQYKQIIESLHHLLVEIPDMIKDKILELRSLGYGTSSYKEKKKQYPNWIVSGIYPIKEINDNSTVEWSNIIAIDIDKSDNENIDLEDVRKKIFELPYVFAVLKSISGLGLYALILVEDGKYTKEYYKYITKLWNQKYGLNIDTQCNNISRKRFIGYDEEATKWIKPDDEDIIPWKLKYIEPKEEPKKQSILDLPRTFNDNKELVRKAIWKLLNKGFSIENMSVQYPYGAWYHIACDFHHFDDGLDMFIKFSQNSPKYNDKICDITKKYNNGKIESQIDDVGKKWCGIAKRIFGKYWWKDS